MSRFASEIMQHSSLISLVVAVLLQSSFGSTEDIASITNSDASQETSLSRAKRGSYNMLRLGRGLHMLRLGKRNDELTTQDEEDLDDALAWLKAYNERYSDNFGVYDTRFPEEDAEVPAHFRYRRSTPVANSAVPATVNEQGDPSPKEQASSDLKDENEEDQLVHIPDNVFLTDDLEDSIIQPQEDGDEEGKRSMGMLRLGKRQLSMLRLGKRSMGMLRLGKREPEDEEEKRSFAMLRLGKRQLSMLRLGKRTLGMLRLGKRPEENLDEEDTDENSFADDLSLGKRPMSMLRLGKRPMSMLRLGKRPMSMLRLGKRPMSMLRLGKRPMSMLRLGKRPMSMLRLGKRPMSMLRLGKREEEEKRSAR